MSKTFTYWFFFYLAIASGCKEFIESSVENSPVVLIAPGNDTESNTYNQNFLWETVPDATGYRLQIASPSFRSISRLVVDTLVNEDKFSVALEPGSYEWRVRAQNGSTAGPYSTSTFIIHESSITAQQLKLKTPVNNLITNQKDLIYKWDALYAAKSYRFQLDDNNFLDTASLVANSTVTNTELTYSFTEEKPYQWRVRAENDTQQSKWSAVYIIIYDATPPVKVSLNLPADNSSLAMPIALQWNAIADAKKYELFILKEDGTTPYNNTFPLTITSTSYSFNAGSSLEKLLWKVRAIDEAGNVGAYSDVRTFIVQ